MKRKPKIMQVMTAAAKDRAVPAQTQEIDFGKQTGANANEKHLRRGEGQAVFARYQDKRSSHETRPCAGHHLSGQS